MNHNAEPATTLDGNEACARIAYRLSEICVIYPITPSSPMGELADQWSNAGQPNIWGDVPSVVEMQSEAGAAGAVHGVLQTGALATTFTASQGLLLMIPNMYKIAGELTPTVFHVAARSLAAQALSIFGDHQDVMATRATGFAQLASASVQEAQDLALIAHAATLASRVPFLHFFDGFRTSHELNTILPVSDEVIAAMVPERLVFAHRQRALDPDHPVLRGTAQNPDVYFQAREAANPWYAALPGIVDEQMQRFAELTGRRYRRFDYSGDPEAERVIVLMGSGGGTAAETVDYLNRRGEKVGLLQVRLYRPFDADAFRAALPASVRRLAVLDRTKEPGALAEPLCLDVMAALSPERVVGGRYGLSSKEFTPAMVKAVFDNLAAPEPKRSFTVGISDDVSRSSLEVPTSFHLDRGATFQAVFYGLGADGTVSANKNSIKIIGARPDTYAQGYFVYDSKKAGSRTVSHLRFGPRPIRSTCLIEAADFVACHQFEFLRTVDVLGIARPRARVLLNAPCRPDEVWDRLPRSVQREILDKDLDVWAIDAYRVARDAGLGRRINTIMQTCFFRLVDLMPTEEAIARIKEAVAGTYRRKGQEVVEQNYAAVDRALENLGPVPPGSEVTATTDRRAPVPDDAPDFVRRVTGPLLAGRGDDLPVSALPADGTWPTGTAAWEKRNIAEFVPEWEPDICIQCGQCAVVCPHGVIRAKFFDTAELGRAPADFPSAPVSARGFPDTRYTLQIYAEDCTGCALCVDACPARNLEKPAERAINMHRKPGDLAPIRDRLAWFEQLPEVDRGHVDFANIRGVQYLAPMFEFSGACAGCGETPYLKLLSQLFGDRAVIANATGCSSIYGGNLPTTPWARNDEGRGPAWSNSLFEDNAEFGLGFRLSADQHRRHAEALLRELAGQLDRRLVDDLLAAEQEEESGIREQRRRVATLRAALADIDDPRAARLDSIAGHLVRRSIWLVGGDGWAYDIGYGGLDHVLSLERDVNVLVMDTEVYSNTGGQMSKSTPIGAVAKFAAGGKSVAKKDLALQAIAYGHVYVARVALGANPQQTLLAYREAERYPGPSLILAYSHCIAHGINMEYGLRQQKLAVNCGHWPLMRYNPLLAEAGEVPFLLDSPRPSRRFREYASREMRYRVLEASDPERAERLMAQAQDHIDRHWRIYEEMASRGTEANPYRHLAAGAGLPEDHR
ncbi:MAG: pyruvate:ferredoxin (flavodoxin) oxidoreductase [Gammaproteobacteria bacterium]